MAQRAIFSGNSHHANIVNAARLRRLVNMTYRDSKGNVTTRTIEPYEITDKGLYAHCLERDGIRLFKIDNIVFTRISEQGFVPRYPIQII